MSEFNLGDKPTSKNTSTTQEKPKQKTLTLPQKQESQAQPENIAPDLTLPNGGTTAEIPLPDFDNAPLPDDENQTVAQPVGEGMAEHVTASGRMCYEAFDQLFCATFLIAGKATGFKTLEEAPVLPTRPEATKAIYETILDTPALHFIIDPSSIWMQRAFAMGAFFVPVAIGVSNEMQQKQQGAIPNDLSQDAPVQSSEKSMRDGLKGR